MCVLKKNGDALKWPWPFPASTLPKAVRKTVSLADGSFGSVSGVWDWVGWWESQSLLARRGRNPRPSPREQVAGVGASATGFGLKMGLLRFQITRMTLRGEAPSVSGSFISCVGELALCLVTDRRAERSFSPCLR